MIHTFIEVNVTQEDQDVIWMSAVVASLAFFYRLSKHLPSADTMSFNVDVDELENSHGATYVRKKAAKVVGENPPKEQG